MVSKRLFDEDYLLLERVRHRDHQAIALLYDRYARNVYSIALQILRDPALAEQTLSNIFLDIWLDATPFLQIQGSLSPAMALIARSRAAGLLLRKQSLDPEFAAPYSVQNHQEWQATREGALAALDQLPPERRRMLERAFFGETAQKEVAALTPQKTPEAPIVGGVVSELAEAGLEVIDLQNDAAFAGRHLHVRDVASHLEGMNRLASVFVGNPTTILQELVSAAVDLCGADSAGISVEQPESSDEHFYHWVATAGQYSGFLNAKLPRYPSACGLTLERGRPQIFRVTQRFFDRMGIQAPTVTDGILFPWRVEATRGTIWIMAHGRAEAFDRGDCEMMQVLADFAATGVRMKQQQQLLMEQARAAGAAAMANTLAHQINNPLQGLMQTVFLFGGGGAESDVFAQQAMGDLLRLSSLVKRLLSFPG